MVIIVSTVVFTAGAIILGASTNKEMLIAGRLVVGFGIGLASTIVPTYIAEITPKMLRGPLVTLNLVCITGGQFIASLIAALFISNPSGWRYMLGLAGVPSVVQLLGFLFMPESPRWLVERGRLDEARATLQRIYSLPSSNPQIEAELDIMKAAAARNRRNNIKNVDDDNVEGIHPTEARDTDQIVLPAGNCCDSLTIVRMLRKPTTRRSLLIGCGIQGFQQLVGINTVMYYGTSILSMAGLGVLLSTRLDANSTVVWLGTLVALTNFVCSLLSPWLISRFRRRSILLVSLSGVTLSLAVLGVSFQLMTSFSPPVNLVELIPVQHQGETTCWAASTCDKCVSSEHCGYCYDISPITGAIALGSCLPTKSEYSSYSTYGRCSQNVSASTSHSKWMSEHCPTDFGWLTLVGLILYLASFAPGMAAVPWAITTEIFPTWARGTGMACSTGSNWISNVIVSVSFLSLTEAITRQGTFLLYTFISVLALVFVALLIPETGNIMLEEVGVNGSGRISPDEDKKV